MQSQKSLTIIQDMDKAIEVLHEVGVWLETSGKNPSRWWQPQNMNKQFFLQYAEPNEFYVVISDNMPAAAMILQDTERNQSWESIDKGRKRKAFYIHWLCVSRQFAGKNLPQTLINFATSYATKRGLNVLRLDTDAKEKKLMELYTNLGFTLKGIADEKNRKTAFFEKIVISD